LDARSIGGPPRHSPSLSSWAELAQTSGRLATRLIGREPAVIEQWVGQMVKKPTMPVVFLKQLAAASVGGRASYRAIIEAQIDVAPGPYTLAPLQGTFEILLHEYESHRIARTLGLHRRSEPGDVSRLRPEAQVHMQFGAIVQPGVEVWRDQ
jgi:hypothetical protein